MDAAPRSCKLVAPHSWFSAPQNIRNELHALQSGRPTTCLGRAQQVGLAKVGVQ